MIHGAAVNGRTAILRILLESSNGFDVNAQDVNGKTTLHDAARFGYYDTIEVLLEFGANPTIKDKGGRTPLRVAREKNAQNIFDLLKTAQAQWRDSTKLDTTAQSPRRTDTGTIIASPKRTDGSLTRCPLPLVPHRPRPVR
jgi:ankyrin repeat domain-containing protein 50